MTVTATITSRGQLTLPKEARRAIKTSTVVIQVDGETVVLRPARCVAGALAEYAGSKAPLRDIREKVWREVARGPKR